MRFIAVALTLAIAAVPFTADAQQGKRGSSPKASAAVKPPSGANRFVTVVEFQRAKRPANANVSIEGYIVLTQKSGASAARLSLVDSTDKVLSVQDAVKTAQTGAPCTVAIGSRQNPGWALTARGLHKLTMYAHDGKRCYPIHDSPPKVRLQGNVGADRKSLVRVTKIEYHDDFGEWRELK